ncbi:hypothetical protein [Actinoallomurus sp. NPDC050550]|uniref:hypothetical protein n=1 Tax=Actinoallomurus sp. NPDC050550 TaxID=3154937 RepID=UPI0033CB74BE
MVVAHAVDGERLETLCVIDSDQMAAESLERPALVVTPEGTWRLYLSCATPGTKHWRVEVLEAADPRSFDPSTAEVVLPGSDLIGVKDPVILRQGDRWHLWASCHPLADPEEADQMVTDYATSADGLEWTWHGTVLAGRPGHWDSRGVRISSVVTDGGETVALRLLDGGHEQVGVARQRGVQCRGARLGSTDHQEVRKRHPAALPVRRPPMR